MSHKGPISTESSPSLKPALGITGDLRWVEQTFPSAPHLTAADSEKLRTGHPYGPAFHSRQEVVQGHGTGYRDYASFSNDLRVLFCDFEYDQEARGKVDGLDMLKFHFKISGKNLIRFEGQQEFVLSSGKSVVALHPQGMVKDDWYAAKAHETSLTLCCSPAQMIRSLHLEPTDLPSVLARYIEDGIPDFFCQTLPLTTRMTRVIEEMLNPPYGRHLRHIHSEARSLDLVCMMLDLLNNDNVPRSPLFRLRNSDIEALHAVKEYLRNEYADPPRIPLLGRQFGLNRTKLTEGFKNLFGETVFEYIQRLRMERARILLTESDWSISRIAETVGYERQSSFSSAFRTKYGRTPMDIRRKT